MDELLGQGEERENVQKIHMTEKYLNHFLNIQKALFLSNIWEEISL